MLAAAGARSCSAAGGRRLTHGSAAHGIQLRLRPAHERHFCAHQIEVQGGAAADGGRGGRAGIGDVRGDGRGGRDGSGFRGAVVGGGEVAEGDGHGRGGDDQRHRDGGTDEVVGRIGRRESDAQSLRADGRRGAAGPARRRRPPARLRRRASF